MVKLTNDYVKQFLKPMEGRIITLTDLRKELQIEKGTAAWDDIRNILLELSRLKEPIVAQSGKRDGVWKVIRRAIAVPVFSVEREHIPPFDLKFPRDRVTDIELPMAGKMVIREGDLILIGGVSNYGKTTMSMNFLAENIDKSPVLMGNEFTSLVEEKYTPTPRFLNRLESIKWVSWVYDDNTDRFTLLPVFEDFAENVVKDKINIFDWINIETGEHYLIGSILNGIKRNVGRGIGIAVLQKSDKADSARGGQFTKDFADFELLIDKYGELGSRITVGKCKESTEPLTGRSWAFEIWNNGVEIKNVREVVRCWNCRGKGYTNHGDCPDCQKVGWMEKKGMKDDY